MIDDARVGEAGEGAAQLLGNVLARRGHALHMRLVDDGVAPRRGAAARSSPQVTAVSITTHFGMTKAESRRSGDRSARGCADAVAEMRIVPAQLAEQRLGVGVDQQLVRVEAVAVRRVVGAVHAVAVELARPHVRQIAVPDLVGDIPAARCGRVSRLPFGSNRQSSTFSALAEKSAKLTPPPSQVAPSGWGRPGSTRRLAMDADELLSGVLEDRSWRAAARSATSEAERPCHGDGSAQTAPALPTFEPP